MSLDTNTTGAVQQQQQAAAPPDEIDEGRGGGRRARRAVGVVALVAVVGAGSWVAASRVGHNPKANAATPAASLSTATTARGSITSTQSIDGTLGYGSTTSVVGKLSGTITKLPAAGTIIARDHELYELDGSNPVILLTGSRPAWRPFASGMTDGPDVKELEQNLKALGYDPDGDMTVDDTFTAATAAAIKRWQDAHGFDQTGSIPLGQVVFLPWTKVRVSSLTASVGGQGMGPVMSVTSTLKQAVAKLDASDAYLVHQGETVQVELPGGKTSNAKITDVGTVATSDNGNGNDNGDNGSSTVDVTATLSDQRAAGSLDQAPVTMDIATASRRNVMYVPVTALLALSEGGFGVEVVKSDGTHQLVGVTTGLYSADGNVEVTSGNLHPGDRVVVSQ
jgi:peptidoglycan hydrolase-like protein with peptidoglycan-binding domain